MYKALSALIIITLITACTNNDEPTKPKSEAGNNTAIPDPKATPATPTVYDSIGIGDVESQMILYVLLDVSSHSPTVAHSEEENKRDRLARATATVSTPYPETLNVTVYNINADNFPQHAYRATVSLYVGKDIVHTFSYITGKNAKTDQQTAIVDILPHLNASAGSSTEIHARCKIEFYSKTDESTLTLDAPAPDSVLVTTKMSNPLRVTFR